MARIRTIKPEFPQSEDIGRLSRDARLLFIQLWTLADDFGKARASSRLLASLLYPFDNDAPALINGWLVELSQNNLVLLYEIEGNHYLQILNWLKHQKIDHPSKSTLPDPREPSRHPRTGRDRKGKEDSIHTDTTTSESKTNNRNLTTNSSNRDLTRARPHDFDLTFWPAYPHKIGKAAARAAFERAHNRTNFAAIMAGLSRYLAKTDDRAWCNPATWLNQDRWLDEPAAFNGSHIRSNGMTEFNLNVMKRTEEIERESGDKTDEHEGGQGNVASDVQRDRIQGRRERKNREV